MNEQHAHLERIIALLNTYPVPADVKVTAPDGHIYFALVNVTPLGTNDLIAPGNPVDMSAEHLTSDLCAMLVRQGTLLAVTPADLADARVLQRERHLLALKEAENQARIAQGLAPLVDEPALAQAQDALADDDTSQENMVDEPTPEPETVRLPRKIRKTDSTPEEN